MVGVHFSEMLFVLPSDDIARQMLIDVDQASV